MWIITSSGSFSRITVRIGNDSVWYWWMVIGMGVG